MFKKFMCLALSLMMVLCTVPAIGFAAEYQQADLVASHVTFTEDGTATINVANVGTEGSATAVFWLGEYVDGVLVESDFVEAEIEAGTNADIDLSVEKDENSVLKAYIWEGVLRGRAIAPVATYPSSSTEIKYALVDGEAWADFKADTYTYNVELERTQFNIPVYDFYAADNSTVVVQPETYEVGANKISVTAADGTPVEYTINISYKAPEFKNFTAADSSMSADEIYVIPKDSATLDNYTEERMKGSSAYLLYPGLASGAVNNPGAVTGFLSSLEYEEGELYVFRTTKGPRNETAYYYGGVGLYDGTNGNYFLTFDIEAPGTMYVYLTEGSNATNLNVAKVNLEKAGYEVHSSSSKTYYKHYEAGATVKVPSMGWDASWDKEGRKFMDSSYFMFGYDDINAAPEAFDVKDVKLASLTYSVEGGDAVTVDGFNTADEGGEYTITVPTGTEYVTIAAEKNEAYSKIDNTNVEVTLADGAGVATIKVTSYDGTEATYTINIKEEVAKEDDASLKTLSYTVAGGEAVKITLVEGINSYDVTLPALTEASDVKVSAKATVGNKADVEITDVTEWVDNQGTATVKVTAIDGTTAVTYSINFTVELHISQKANKIYDLTSFIGDAIKAENDAYHKEGEETKALSAMVIGENLDTASLRSYEKTDKYYSPSEDMLGASYIRTKRYYGGTAKTISVQTGSTITQKVYNDDGTYTTNTGITFGTGAGDYNIRVFNIPEQKFFAGTEGWLSFKVTSDCTVVLGDFTDKDINVKYPNAEAQGWTKSDGTTNKIATTSFYKTFKAGDTVVIPNYGLAGNIANTNKVEYIYTDADGNEQTYTTDVAHTIFSWEGVCIAVKWDVEVSSDTSLSYIKVAGEEVDLDSMVDNTVSVYAPAGATEVTLEAKATSAAAKVTAPETIAVGSAGAIKVTAENGDVVTYYVKVEARDTKSTQLSSLQYKIGDGDWTDVDGFDASKEGGSYEISDITYVKDGVSVSVKGVALNSGDEFTASATLVYGTASDVTINVVSEDETVTTDYTVTFTMAEKVFDAVVVGTADYQALFADGKYTGDFVIKTAAAPTYTEGTASMVVWDADGIAKNRTYTITVNGEAYSEGETTVFTYAQMKQIKTEKEADGSTVSITASGWNYDSSKITTMVGSIFNSGTYHTTGFMGKRFAEADFQIMTHREIAAGRVSSNAAYVDSKATKEFVLSQEKYLMEVTPNSKATVYMAFNNADAANHAKFIADDWTFINSIEAVRTIRDTISDEYMIDEYKTLPSGVARDFYMIKADAVIEDVPYFTVKIQPDTNSNTLGIVFPYVWYKTVEEGETLSVPTPGVEGQHGYKGFIIEGEHVEWKESEPEKDSDATLKTLTVNGSAINLVSGTYEYDVAFDYGTTSATVEAEANSTLSTVGGTGTVEVADGGKITVTVTAEDGTVQAYVINVSIANIPFKNVTGAVSASNIYRAYAANDEEYPITGSLVLSGYSTESEAKAAYNERIANFNTKYGTNAHQGTNFWTNYPMRKTPTATTENDVTTYSVEIDNPVALTAAELGSVPGEEWVFKTAKGKVFTSNPIADDENLGVYGDNDEYITFDITKPGTMYVADKKGLGYNNEGWEKASGVSLLGTTNVYYKHFDANSTVTVPAFNADKTKLETLMNSANKITDTPVFMFAFDDLTNAAITEVTYEINGNSYTADVNGDEIEITVLPGVESIKIVSAVGEITGTTITETQITLADGTGKLVATAPDGVTTKEYTVTVSEVGAYQLMDTTSNGTAWYSAGTGMNGIYGTKELKAFGSYLVAIEDVSASDAGTISAWSDRKDKEKISFNKYINKATVVLTPRQGASPDTADVAVYRLDETTGTYVNDKLASFTRQEGDKEAEVYTGEKYNASNVYGFRKTSNGSLDKALFAGAYDGTDGNYWITFVPTSDCTVVLGDMVNLGWPNLDKDEWQNSGYTYLGSNANTYIKHFEAGEVVQIPNYGIPNEYPYNDSTIVTYTYLDVNGKTQTVTMPRYREWQNWYNIGIAVVWDDFEVEPSSDTSLSALTYKVGDETVTVTGFTAGEDVTEYTVELEAGTTEVTVAASMTDSYAQGVVVEQADIANGDFSATVTATAEDGTTKVYTVYFNVKVDSSLALKSVKVNDTEATLQADGSYYIEVESHVDSATVTATAEDEASTVSYSSETVELEAGALTEVTVTVTSTAGGTQNYKVVIKRTVDTAIDGSEDGGEL